MTPVTDTIDTPSQRHERAFELAVFLFLIVPSMCLSFLVIREGDLGFVVTAAATMLRDLALVSLIAFFLWRNGEPKDRIGLRFGGLKDVVRAVFLFLAMGIAAAYLEQFLHVLEFSAPRTPLPKFLTAQGIDEYALAVVLVVIVAFAEEIIFRGYLIRRLKEVTGSAAAAIVLSSVIFALGHGYEGTVGVLTVGFMGLVFALVYVWTRGLTAPIIMHFLRDFIGIVVVPLLKHK